MRRFAKSDKVADLLKHGISNALLTELGDERLKWVTVTEVSINNDLSLAKVYYTVLEPALNPKSAEAAISENMRDLRRFLASRLRLKQLPDLVFTYDQAQESARRIDTLLESLRKEENGGG